MKGFDRRGDGTLDSRDIERKSAPGWSSRKWTLRSSFVGPQGIRSGWSMLIFTMILLVELLVTRVPVNLLLHSMKMNPNLEAWSPTVAAGILVLLVLVGTAIMAKNRRASGAFLRIHRQTQTVAIRAGDCGRRCSDVRLGSRVENEWMVDL